MGMNDLGPRIKELRAQQDRLLKTRAVIDAEQVKSYASDLRSLLTETDIARSKGFLRTFIKKITVYEDRVTICYKLPVPCQWNETEDVVLPTGPLGGPEGIRTPYLLNAIQSLSQLSYRPVQTTSINLPDGTV